jgi:hypothetical protein
MRLPGGGCPSPPGRTPEGGYQRRGRAPKFFGGAVAIGQASTEIHRRPLAPKQAELQGPARDGVGTPPATEGWERIGRTSHTGQLHGRGAQSTASMQPQLCAQPSGNKLKTFGFRPVGCCRLADNHQLLIYPPTKLWSAKRVQGFPTLKVDLFKKFILLRPHQSFGPTVPPDHPPNCGAPNGSWWAPSSPGRPFLQQPKSRT